METILTIKNLNKRYGRIQALKNVSFEIKKGNVYGILGPNGSGKSTTLGITLNVVNATSGEYQWFDGALETHEALKKVALTIKEYFNKKYEFTFRLGGEEFGVVLFDISKDILENCLKEMNKRVLELQIEHKNSKILPVLSISMGAIIYEPNSYISANKLYKQADECLYESKQNGRNQYHIYKG